MKARLYPLRGKYYGTEIEIDFEDGYKEVVKLWDSGDYTPSVRELEKHGYTKEQWDTNELVDNGFGGKINIMKLDITCDSHFESQATYDRAIKMINAINSYEQ